MCSTRPAPTTAAEAIAVAEGALADVALRPGLGVVDHSHDELTELIQSLRRLQARCDSVLLEAVAEVDARGSFALDGCLTAGAWLRANTRVSGAQAARTVRTARVLRSGVLPNTKAALEAGELTAGHAQVVATAVVGAPDEAVALIEPHAVQVAVESDVSATAAVMRCFQNALDPDAADAAALRRYDRAGLTLSPTLGGSMSISGLADEVSGATIATAVDLASPLVFGDSRTAARRRLDGLVEICNRYLSDPTAPRRGGGGRPHLVVTIDHPGLQAAAAPSGAGASEPSPGGSLSWIGPVASSTAGRVGCDSTATFVTLGPDGEVVEAGTQRRFFTVAQRRTILARDGDRCCAPYCDRPVAWSDAHHLVAVEDGGPTTVANGSLPCEAHHVMVHEGRWRLRRLPDGRYQLFHPGTGIVLGPEPPRPGRGRPLPHRRE